MLAEGNTGGCGRPMAELGRAQPGSGPGLEPKPSPACENRPADSTFCRHVQENTPELALFSH